MKRILIIILLSFIGVHGFAQSIFGVYGGGGFASSNNYDAGPSGGIEYLKGIGVHGLLGFDLFYQGYSLYYDNELNSARHHMGLAGYIDRNLTSYAFFTPKVSYTLDKKRNITAFVTAGIGYNIGGFDSIKKWDQSYSSIPVLSNTAAFNYDSVIDKSANINKMLFRFGTGLTEYLHVGRGRWCFTFTEDFGFLFTSLNTNGDPNDASHTKYSPARLNPTYISIHIGISRYARVKWWTPYTFFE